MPESCKESSTATWVIKKYLGLYIPSVLRLTRQRGRKGFSHRIRRGHLPKFDHPDQGTIRRGFGLGFRVWIL